MGDYTDPTDSFVIDGNGQFAPTQQVYPGQYGFQQTSATPGAVAGGLITWLADSSVIVGVPNSLIALAGILTIVGNARRGRR